ncbi:STAS domain-containing protein [Niallia sp. 03133]|uniref:STAS domain-containing protein n=1 Tax=Niallia sp. 03133 TaxID=3458060 RepID=UPI0040451872
MEREDAQMSLTDKSLYDYIVKNSAKITEKWFTLMNGKDGSIYSKKSSSSVKGLLENQHASTIKTAMSAFLEDQQAFSDNLSNWAKDVAQSRVDLGTPAHEVLQALSITRKTIWDEIELCILMYRIPTETVLKWSSIFHCAFDQLNNQFGSMYHEFTQDRFFAQQKLIQELSIPVIPIINHIGVFPLIGNIDSIRAKLILEQVPERCLLEKISYLLIDLSGIAVIDTIILHELLKLIKVLHFIGIKPILSGIRPEVAETIEQPGISLGEVETYATLKQAFSKWGIERNDYSL